jgi:NTP pyrophosphatase (non-canonical NTP hydrolase)
MSELVKFVPKPIDSSNGHRENGQKPLAERRRPTPILDSIQEIQRIQKSIVEVGMPDDHPKVIMQNMTDEIDELRDAIALGDRREIAGEIPDIFMNLTRVAIYYDIPLEVAISDKIARNAEKYNPYKIKELREKHDIGSVEAMNILKNQWDRSRDKREFCRACGR